jgi:phosphate transport system substrate-binding protein
MKSHGSRCFAGLGGLLLAAWLFPLAAAQPLKTGGTGAAVGTIELMAQEYRRQDPSFEVNVVAGLGTSGGIKAVAAGVLDFALVGRPLKDTEMAAGLVAYELGRTPFVLVSNQPGIKNLSQVELATYIGSDAPHWPGGAPVRLVLRPVNDSDTALLGDFSPEVKKSLAKAQARGGMVRAITDQESANESERLPGSLGTSSIALLRSEKRTLAVLSLDGVAPSPENLASGAYPHGKTLAIVTQGNPAAATRKFLDFIASAAGREVLTRLGYLLPAQ